MTTFLQSVELLERCFLQEVLFWVAFQRVPTIHYTRDELDLRASKDVGGYVLDFVDPHLSNAETDWANIPFDPRWPLHPDETVTRPIVYFDELLAKWSLSRELREQLRSSPTTDIG